MCMHVLSVPRRKRSALDRSGWEQVTNTVCMVERDASGEKQAHHTRHPQTRRQKGLMGRHAWRARGIRCANQSMAITPTTPPHPYPCTPRPFVVHTHRRVVEKWLDHADFRFLFINDQKLTPTSVELTTFTAFQIQTFHIQSQGNFGATATTLTSRDVSQAWANGSGSGGPGVEV
jgi:hypothetical protein